MPKAIDLFQSVEAGKKNKAADLFAGKQQTNTGPLSRVAEPKKGLFGRIMKSVPFKLLSGVGQVMEGGAKGIISTVRGAEKLGVSLGDVASKAIGISEDAREKSKETVELAMPTEKDVTPETTLEKVGFFGEQLAELLVPVGSAFGAGKITSKLPKSAQVVNYLKSVGVSEKVARIVGGIASGGVKIGTKAIGEGIDVTAKRAIQTGDVESSVDEGKGAAVWTAVLGTAGEIAGKTFSSIRKSIEKSSLKLTPAQKASLGSRIDDATSYLAENPLTKVGSGTERLAAINERVGTYEQAIQEAIKENDIAVIGVKNILDKLDDIKEVYRGTRYFEESIKAVEDVKKNLIASYGDDAMLNLEQLNKFKRSLWDSAYNEAGMKVIDDVDHDAGSIIKDIMDKIAKDEGLQIMGKNMDDFLEEYGKVLNARKFVKIASGRSDIGLAMKLLMGGAGVAMAGPAGIVAGSLAQAGNVMTRTRSALVAALKGLEDLPVNENTIKAVIRAVILGMSENEIK